MSERFPPQVFFPDLIKDLKLSSWSDYKKNSWTEWMDKRIFCDDLEMKKGFSVKSYKSWINFYLRAFRPEAPHTVHMPDGTQKEILREPLFIPTLGYEQMVGMRPLWSIGFMHKGFDSSDSPRSLYEVMPSRSKTDIDRNYYPLIEREKIIDANSNIAIVERCYDDREGLSLAGVTIVVKCYLGVLVFYDNLDKVNTFQYRNDAFLINIKDVKSLFPHFRGNKRLVDSISKDHFLDDRSTPVHIS